jgi:hypothetical protein
MNVIFIFIVVLIVVVGLLFVNKDNFTQVEVKTDVMDLYDRFKNRFVDTPGENLPGIDQVYVISMPQRIDYIKKQMEKLNYSVCYKNKICRCFANFLFASKDLHEIFIIYF